MSDTLQRLKSFLLPLAQKGAALAFSGGVDSSLLLAVLAQMHRELPFPFLVLNVVSSLQSSGDEEEVRKAEKESGVRIYRLACDPLSLEPVRNNDPLRCYHCKKMLFETMIAFAKERGIENLIEGTHGDDLHAYRPGRKALEELKVISPLALLGISKKEVRAMAAELNLQTAARPASPCLATRFDYGTLLTEEKLQQVAAGENFLRSFLPPAADLRLRVLEKQCRIETNPGFFSTLLEHREEVVEKLKSMGFEKVTLDLAGFVSGGYDDKLKGMKDV